MAMAYRSGEGFLPDYEYIQIFVNTSLSFIDDWTVGCNTYKWEACVCGICRWSKAVRAGVHRRND